MSRVVKIEIGFDFICPWCLIGLRHLQVALAALRAERPDVTVQLVWRGVQLLPQVPAEGLPFDAFYRARLGSDAAVAQRRAQVLRAADEAGARIDYSAITRMPNTADAHRLLDWAGQHDSAAQCDDLLERLLRAYFEQGADLGDPAVLLAHGAAAGFTADALRPLLRGAAHAYYGSAESYGGVPYFAIAGQPLISGAQPAALLLAALRTATV